MDFSNIWYFPSKFAHYFWIKIYFRFLFFGVTFETEVEDVEVQLEVDVVEYFVGRDDDPHGEDLEGEEAGEEEEDDGAEHHHDLLPAPGDGGRLPRALLARDRGVGAPWEQQQSFSQTIYTLASSCL